MKLVLIAIIGIMAWQSPEIRSSAADMLENAADVVRPESEKTPLGRIQRAFR